MPTYCYLCTKCGETLESPWRVGGSNIAGIVCCGTEMRRDWKAEGANIDLSNCRAVTRGR